MRITKTIVSVGLMFGLTTAGVAIAGTHEDKEAMPGEKGGERAEEATPPVEAAPPESREARPPADPPRAADDERAKGQEKAKDAKEKAKEKAREKSGY